MEVYLSNLIHCIMQYKTLTYYRMPHEALSYRKLRHKVGHKVSVLGMYDAIHERHEHLWSGYDIVRKPSALMRDHEVMDSFVKMTSYDVKVPWSI